MRNPFRHITRVFRRKPEKRGITGYLSTPWVMHGSRSKKNVNSDTVEAVTAFSRAVTIVSQTLASLPLCVYQRKNEKIREHADHPIYDLLKFAPSSKYNTFTFIESFVKSLMIYRRAFAYPVRNEKGRVVELLFIPESEIQVLEVEMTNTIDRFLSYRISGLPGFLFDEDIIHVRLQSRDGMNTRSVMQVYGETFGRALAETDYGASFYGNGAHLRGVLETDSNITPETAAIMMEQWRRKYSGADNVGEVALLHSGLKFRPIASTPIDADYINNRKMTVEDVANITGVPVFLLANNDRSTFNNIEHLDRTFVNYTLGPLARAIEAEFNVKLFGPIERKSTYVQFDLRQLLRGDRKGQAEWYQTMFNVGSMSPNDIRRAENMNPYEGGDKYFVQLNLADVNNIDKIQGEGNAQSEPAGPEPDSRKSKVNGTRKKDLFPAN